MMAVLRLKRKPLLLLDETLASVSDEYVDATGSFLQQLSEAMKVDVLLVTHKQAFLDHADKSYRCSEVMSEGDLRHLELRSVG
jgi:ABC-type thiamine transport system ATPase subunit